MGRLGAAHGAPAPPRARDRAAVSHHYDVSNAFYRRLLGPSLVCSCAYFEAPDDTLEAAQARKLELICRKRGWRPGERLLDVGCGWGSRSASPTTASWPTGRTTRSPGAAIEALQAAGLEPRDVESLREHYVLTLRRWLEDADISVFQVLAARHGGPHRLPLVRG